MTTIREPVARHYYPGDLLSQLKTFLAGFNPPTDLPHGLIGAILPHAGWAHSGGVAARTLACVAQMSEPETCVIFGTDHTGISAHSLFPVGVWTTPLGELQIDEELSSLIVDELSDLVIADPNAHHSEHSIEVLLPMVKYFWSDAQIIPITVRPDPDSLRLGAGIAALVKQKDRKIVLITSTDLTHYGSLYGFMPAGTGAKGYHWLRNNDQRMIEHLCAVDGKAVLEEARRNWNACGAGAAAALTAAVAMLGKKKGFLVEYTTSHDPDPEDEFTYGVGYAGVVF